jgi:uncharacterized protein YxjI
MGKPAVTKLSVRNKMKIDLGDRSATVHKAMVGIRDRYKIDVDGGPEEDDALILAVAVCMDSMARG